MTWILLMLLLYGWFWNAEIQTEGVVLHTAWTVDEKGGAENYRADIVFYYPEGADVTVLAVAENERVRLKEDDDLVCNEDGIEVRAVYQVHSKGRASGETVTAGIFADDTGGDGVVDMATGPLHKKIRVSGFVETPDTPSCAVGDEGEGEREGDTHDRSTAAVDHRAR